VKTPDSDLFFTLSWIQGPKQVIDRLIGRFDAGYCDVEGMSIWTFPGSKSLISGPLRMPASKRIDLIGNDELCGADVVLGWNGVDGGLRFRGGSGEDRSWKEEEKRKGFQEG
ncbi:MAG: hypothetical protein Q9192_003064, partial [Flavoplaca navasiana]